ncbi:hypothetical protein HDU80_006872 [Chytriomyces hyalinus]|nr:hypothetical protein HDU80_006872 [Chytriomyces hyalinus]
MKVAASRSSRWFGRSVAALIAILLAWQFLVTSNFYSHTALKSEAGSSDAHVQVLQTPAMKGADPFCQFSLNNFTTHGKGRNRVPKPPRILYYNTHAGTNANMEYIMGRLGLKLSHFNPDKVDGAWEMKHERAQELVSQRFAANTCKNYDIVIISDTLPHGRALILSLLSKAKHEKCQAQIIVELTNRFDWGLEHNRGLWDSMEFHKMIWRLDSVYEGKKIIWTENNPLESRHMADFTWSTPEFRLMRPAGYSPLPAIEISEEESKLVAVYPADGMTPSPLTYILEKLGIPHKVLPKHYGGPKTLAKYRAYMELPYQVSTMKLYENLAAGVVMLFPSKAFMTELVLKDIMFFYPALTMFRTGKDEPDWERFMDYYHPDLAPYFYYFESFEHLREIILSPNPIDTNNVRMEGPKYYEGIRNKTVRGWARLIHEQGFSVKVDNEYGPFSCDSIDPPYRASLPEAEIYFTTDEDESFMRLRDWKMGEEARFELVRQERYMTLTPFELSALQYRRWMEEPVRKTVMTGLEASLEDVDQKLLEMINHLESVALNPDSKQVLLTNVYTTEGMALIGKMKSWIDQHPELYRKQFRAFAQLARLVRIAHLSLNASVGLRGDFKLMALVPMLSETLKSATAVTYPWLLSKMFKSVQHLVESFTDPRGIVFVIEDSGFDKVLQTIGHLRKNLHCNLPIEVFYNGDYLTDDHAGRFRRGNLRLSDERRRTLDRIPNVMTRDIHHAFDRFWENADTTEHAAPFAIVASRFKQVLYIQQDQILLENPETMLEKSIAFKNEGVLLEKGPASPKKGHSQWVTWFLGGEAMVSDRTREGRYYQNMSRHEIDGGFMAFDKTRNGVLHGLLATCHLNRNQVKEGSIDWFFDGKRFYNHINPAVSDILQSGITQSKAEEAFLTHSGLVLNLFERPIPFRPRIGNSRETASGVVQETVEFKRKGVETLQEMSKVAENMESAGGSMSYFAH